MKKVFLLDNAGVDSISSLMEEWSGKNGVNNKTIIRLRLTMEEMLIRISKRFNGRKKGTLIIGKRFGKPYFKVRYGGESYDPTKADPGNEWANRMLGKIGLAPMWSYRDGMNEICLYGPARTVRTETRLGIAAILAIVLGLAGASIPAALTGIISDFVFAPVSGAFMGVLNTFIGLLVFLSVVTGICSIGTISDFSKMGKNVLLSVLRNTFVGTGLCMLLMIPFFHFGTGTVAGGSSQAEEIVELLFSIFPSNPISPFQDRNMLQIVFLAILTGCSLLVLGEQIGAVREMLEQLNLLVSSLVQGICRFLPLYIFASLTLMLWENGIGIFFMLWKPLVIYLLMGVLMLAGKMAWTAFRLHINPFRVLGKIKSSMIIGFTTCSTSAAFATILDINEKELGISQKLSRFATSILSLFEATTHGTIFAVIICYLAEYYGMPVNIGWLVTAWIMCSIFSMTLPPVSGGTLVVTGVLMTQLNIPGEGLVVAGLLSMILDFVGTGLRIGLIHFELLLRADHLKMWDRSVLN